MPAYNAERYISSCLDSIINQTFKEFEIIVINDGSVDGTKDILEAYAKKDKRIRAYHKTNSGVSDSRNYGINLAKGEYLTFVDSDDWMEPDYLLEVSQMLNFYNPEIMFNGWVEESLNTYKKEFKTKGVHILTSSEAIKELCTQELFGWAPFGTFYRSGIAKKNKFPISICFAEDLHYKYHAIKSSNGVIIYAPINKYHYIKRDTSVTVNYNIIKRSDDIFVISEIIDNEDENIKDILYFNELIPRKLNYTFIGFASKNNDEIILAQKYEKELLHKWVELFFDIRMKKNSRIKLLLLLLPWKKYIGKKIKKKKGLL